MCRRSGTNRSAGSAQRQGPPRPCRAYRKAVRWCWLWRLARIQREPRWLREPSRPATSKSPRPKPATAPARATPQTRSPATSVCDAPLAAHHGLVHRPPCQLRSPRYRRQWSLSAPTRPVFPPPSRPHLDRLRRATRTTSWHEPDIRNLHLVTYLLHVDTHPPCPRNLLCLTGIRGLHRHGHQRLG